MKALIFCIGLIIGGAIAVNISAVKETQNLSKHYNTSRIDLPLEIDCAVKGDTLIVIGEREETENAQRVISIGFKQSNESPALDKSASNLKSNDNQ